jgi:DNA-binding winged helix-turn-helix (wHTH) protein
MALVYLANNIPDQQRVFSYNVIIEHLWVGDENASEEAVRTHIKGLRHKLKLAGMTTDPIETIYGVGYRLRPAPVLNKMAIPEFDQHLSLLIADPDPVATAEIAEMAQQAGMLVRKVDNIHELRTSL